MNKPRKIIVAITGASGSIYARLLCEKLCALKKVAQIDEIAVICTDNGVKVMNFEDNSAWLKTLPVKIYNNNDMFSPVASGSANYTAMVIIPCSMGTMGRIASGISSDLIGRAADVMLKERRKLVLVTREAPLTTIHLQNMSRLSECGAVICPASPSFYSKPQSIEELCNTIIERVISLLDIDAPHFEWGK